MKLYEILNQSDPRKEIEEWLDMYHVKNYTIRPDGVVDVEGDVILARERMEATTTLPVQFGKVSGDFDCSDSHLTSLKGCPHHVGQGFKCYGTKITSLQHAPQYVGGRFVCFETKIKSFSGVDKIIKYVGGDFIGPTNGGVTHILGLLLISGVRGIQLDSGPVDGIMNKYVGTGDILSAQDELIDAGFIDQARL